jgi:hypothetical protein
MFQLEEWIVIILALILLVLPIVYLVYFKVSRKLFPQLADFSSEIKPGEGMTVCKITGSGIIKSIELKTNENSIIAITVDGINHTLLTVGRELGSNITSKQNENVLDIREQLDEKFSDNCTIHIQNRGTGILLTNGNISFEIKKGLKTSIRTVFSELK